MLVWVCHVYVTAIWPFIGGAQFGRRILLNATPSYLIGLAALVQTGLNRGVSIRTISAICGAFIVWNFLLIAQYITELLPHASNPESGWAVISNQFVVIGEVIRRFDELIAQRF